MSIKVSEIPAAPGGYDLTGKELMVHDLTQLEPNTTKRIGIEKLLVSLNDPYEFEVGASSFIVTGQTIKVISDYIGYNLLFFRNAIKQSIVNTGGTYYSWDKTIGTLTILGGAPFAGELIELYPI